MSKIDVCRWCGTLRAGMPRRSRLVILVLLVLIVVLWLSREWMLQSLADFLTVQEPFLSADAVLILGGSPSYEQAGEWLATEKQCRVIVYDRRPNRLVRRNLLPSHRDLTRQHLKDASIPEDRHWNLPGVVEGTGDLIEALGAELAPAPGFRIVVLCDPWDSRRIRTKINRLLPAVKARQFQVLEAALAGVDSTNWWHSDSGRRWVVQGWVKWMALTFASEDDREWNERTPEELRRAAVGG